MTAAAVMPAADRADCPRCGPVFVFVALCSRCNPVDDCDKWKTAPHQQHKHYACSKCRQWWSDR